MKVFYVAAHAGFSLDQVPLGGGGSICARLSRRWREKAPFDLELVTPALLGDDAPEGHDLVRYSEWDYARFCDRFSRAATTHVLSQARPGDAVLCNDVSEGPDFQRLAASRLRVFTIYHVDVVDYVARMYGRGWIAPQRLTAAYRGLERAGLRAALPGVLRLIFERQADSVRASQGLIVPSRRMEEVLRQCYPGDADGKVHVLPWGIWEPDVSHAEIEKEAAALRREWALSPEAPLLLTLSRISPEKGQDRLLKALALWEKQSDYPSIGVTLVIAGEAAFMQGLRFEKRLRALAARLKRSRVIFAGYAAGARKQALFRLASLYVFPSRHESYGLTMLEAMRAGCPILATPTHGACEVFDPAFGELTTDLLASLRRLLAQPDQLLSQGRAAQAYAQSQRFEEAADRLASLITTGRIAAG